MRLTSVYRTEPYPSYCLVTLAALLILLCGRADCGQSKVSNETNFLFVLCDDLGYGDLRCYGHPKISTPNIDRLAAEGIKLTACYAAAANCSPARTGLLTGRTPYRAGIYNWIPDGSPVHLRRQEVTVPALLQSAGYATCHVGKWHCNGHLGASEQPQPHDHGFAYWFSTQNNARPSHHNPINFVRNGKATGPLEGYSSTLIVDEAIRWLQDRPRNRPFCLFVWFHAPHEPIATAKEFAEMYPGADDPKRAVYYGNITQMDYEFGRLIRSLDELNVRDNTFVFFTSDNGPAYRVRHPYGSAGPLREKKGHLYEGGIRVPGIIRWPEKTNPGQVCDEPVSGVDLLPTMCEIAGVSAPIGRKIDGASIVPIFEDQPITRRVPLYWQFDRAPSKPKVAMRQGDWKILAHLTGPELRPSGSIGPRDMEIMKGAELASFELYNLRKDVGETTDLARSEPQRLKTLAETLRKLYREVKSEGPVWPAWERPRSRPRPAGGQSR